MIKGEGDDMGRVEDMGVISQGGEDTQKEKPPKYNAKCENEQGQIKAVLKGYPNMCPQTKELLTKPLRKNDD